MPEKKVYKMKARLSRVATFDDLLRNARVLRDGCEQEFRTFVKSEENCRKKWNAAEQKVECLQEKVSSLQSDLGALKTRLAHALRTIDKEMTRRRHAEQDRDALEQQLNKVRELLFGKENQSIRINDRDRERLSAYVNTSNIRTHYNTQYDYDSPQKLNPIMESSCSMADIDFDPSVDDLDIPHTQHTGKRRSPSAPPLEEYDDRSPKRHCRERDLNSSIVTTTRITVNGDGKPVMASTEVNVPPKLNKSLSEPALDKHLQAPERDADSEPESDDSFFGTPRNRNHNSAPRRSILKRTPASRETPVLGRSSSAGKGLNRVHVFISRTFVRREICVPCGKRIGFGRLAMKCKDCKVICHPDCKDNVPLPCVPNAPSTPGTQSGSGTISDYAPTEAPMIPSLIIHCVNEVELRGLSEVGIYRMSGSDREVKDLKERFLRGRGMPRLGAINDIHVICCCIKDFLRSLREPLVTYKLWREFVKASENPDTVSCHQVLYSLVELLPQPNRDTLAFLCLHLQKVSEYPECKMPILSLAKMFGPTLVGYSTQDPDPGQMFTETAKQNNVMRKLLELSTDYWIGFINSEDVSLYPADPNTPVTPDCSRPARHAASRLGPVLTPGSYEAERTQISKSITQTPSSRFTPRHNNTTAASRRQFFTSPFINH